MTSGSCADYITCSSESVTNAPFEKMSSSSMTIEDNKINEWNELDINKHFLANKKTSTRKNQMRIG